jgi:hypothetical protein
MAMSSRAWSLASSSACAGRRGIRRADGIVEQDNVRRSAKAARAPPHAAREKIPLCFSEAFFPRIRRRLPYPGFAMKRDTLKNFHSAAHAAMPPQYISEEILLEKYAEGTEQNLSPMRTGVSSWHTFSACRTSSRLSYS